MAPKLVGCSPSPTAALFIELKLAVILSLLLSGAQANHVDNPLALQSTGQQIATGSCERMSIPFCQSMSYNITRMPNFFGDPGQFVAMERAERYRDLVESGCSQHLHQYLCELIAPLCIKDGPDVMKKFKIYPCRSFCRKVKDDCKLRLAKSTASFLDGFNCDELPYEFNGDNGQDQGGGPCHELKEDAKPPTGGRKTNYPYQPQLEPNMPPFMDTSSIDLSHIPSVMNINTLQETTNQDLPDRPPQNRNPQNRATLSSNSNSLQSSIQSFLVALSRYSNILSIATVIVLLLALNFKRIRRIKEQLRPSKTSNKPTNNSSPHSAGSSSTSYHGTPRSHKPSQLPNFNQQSHGGKSMSPSSCSCSLMLVAGNNKQPPRHQIIRTTDNYSEPSQKILQAMSQKTLINVNGTLERQTNKNSNIRYLVMPPPSAKRDQEHQQLFSNTLDSRGSSNQYDCIQVTDEDQYDRPPSSRSSLRHQQPPQQLQQQQQQQHHHQMFSNILLTSPSHRQYLYM